MSFRASVVAPERELFTGEAEFVVVPGYDDGDVGFLRGHAPYIGRLGCGTVRIRESGGREHRYVVYQGFVEFAGNRLTVLASHAQLPDEITPEMVEKDREEIPSLPSRTRSEFEEKQRRMSMLKARMQVLARR